MLTTLLALSGGVCYIGRKAYQLLSAQPLAGRGDSQRRPPTYTPPVEQVGDEERMRRWGIDQEVAISSLTVGAAAGTVLFYTPLHLIALPPLIYLSVPTVRNLYHAWRRQEKGGTAVFDLLLVMASLAAGEPLAAALHFWLRALSKRRLQWIKRAAQQQFQPAPLPSENWVQRHGTPIKRPLHTLVESDIVIVQTGDLIAVDGVVDWGTALVDEQKVTQQPAPTVKAVDDYVFATTLTLAGQLHVKVDKTGEATKAAYIHQVLAQAAATKSATNKQATHQADTLLLPMLGLGALTALLIGSISAAALVNARPGYATEEVVAVHSLRYLNQARCAGLLVKDSAVFATIVNVDTVIFAFSLARRHDFRETVIRLRQQTGCAIFLLVDQRLPESHLVAKVGVDGLWKISSAADAIALIQRAQRASRTVCYIGDGQADEALLGCVDLPIAFCPLPALPNDVAQVLLLQDRLPQVLCLFDLAQQVAATRRRALQLTFWPGMVSMIGALLGAGLVPSVLLNDGALLFGSMEAMFAFAPKARAQHRPVEYNWQRLFMGCKDLALNRG